MLTGVPRILAIGVLKQLYGALCGSKILATPVLCRVALNAFAPREDGRRFLRPTELARGILGIARIVSM